MPNDSGTVAIGELEDGCQVSRFARVVCVHVRNPEDCELLCRFNPGSNVSEAGDQCLVNNNAVPVVVLVCDRVERGIDGCVVRVLAAHDNLVYARVLRKDGVRDLVNCVGTCPSVACHFCNAAIDACACKRRGGLVSSELGKNKRDIEGRNRDRGCLPCDVHFYDVF